MTVRSGNQQWRFSVSSPKAERVFLVQRNAEGASTWIEMARDSLGDWSVLYPFVPGHHSFHYFTVEGGAYINCGTEGLTALRLEPADEANEAPSSLAMSA